MKLIKTLTFVIIPLLSIFSCSDDETSDEFWNSITVSAKKSAFPIVFTSSDIGTCHEHGASNLEKISKSKINNIPGANTNGVLAFPSPSDNLYTPVAEELKFIFDANGNNTFQNYPSFVNEMECFNIDSLNWHGSIIDDINQPNSISLGAKVSLKNDAHIVYVRGVYNKAVNSSHSIALYIIEKEKNGIQKNAAGNTVSVTHKNVLNSSATNSTGKTLSSAAANDEFRESFQFELSNQSSNEVYFIAVIYDLNNQTPISVINSLKILN